MMDYYNPKYCTWPWQMAFVVSVVALLVVACLA
jgi:hypothetical protein